METPGRARVENRGGLDFSSRSSIQATVQAKCRAAQTAHDIFRDQRHLLTKAAADLRRDDASSDSGILRRVGDTGAPTDAAFAVDAESVTRPVGHIEDGDGARAASNGKRRLPAKDCET